jgi:hypothetical protein
MQIMDTATGPRHYYVNLRTREVVSSVSIYDWDLAFDCRKNGFEIFVNSAKGMGVYNSETTFFETLFESINYNWAFDNIKEDFSKTAIGAWGDFSFLNPQSFKFVYLVNRGQDFHQQSLGFKKLMIQGSKNGIYSIRYANYDNTDEHIFSVQKRSDVSFVYFSFEGGGQLKEVEPRGKDWDFLLTPYIDSTYSGNREQFILNNQLSVYDGILINPENRWVTSDTTHSFEEIDFRKFNSYIYSRQQNLIGCQFYRWDWSTKKFQTRKNRTYLIKDHRDYVYKLRFLEFNRNDFNAVSLSFEVKNL